MNDVEYSCKDGSNINNTVTEMFSTQFHMKYVLLIV